jgi:hypothetical protein
MNKLPPYITKDTRPPSELDRLLNWFTQDQVARYNSEKYVAKCVVVK